MRTNNRLGCGEEVSYVFPLPPDAGVCAFKAVIDNGEKVIKGIVKEKNVAKSEYKQAVAKGKTAALLEKHHADSGSTDPILSELPNSWDSLSSLSWQFQTWPENSYPVRLHMPSRLSTDSILSCISFVSIIQHDGSSPDSLRLMVPITIAPRYGTAPTITATEGTVSSAPNALTLNVSLQMTGAVTSITCPTHPISLTLGSNTSEHASADNHDPKSAHVLLEAKAFLEADIVLVLNVQGLDKPRCTIEVDERDGTEAYALTFVPRFNLPTLPRQGDLFLVSNSGRHD